MAITEEEVYLIFFKIKNVIFLFEIKLSEILKDSYEIGELGKFIREPTNKSLPKPRILFGVNTGKSFENGSGPDTFLSCSKF